MAADFAEIAHSGGKIVFRLVTDTHGNAGIQTSISSSRPVPAEWIGVYFLPPGIAVGKLILGGIGQPFNKPPFPGCFFALIASDGEGRFGHNCPSCEGYWRSGPWPNVCPYCGERAESHEYLSNAQQRYLAHYYSVLKDGEKRLAEGQEIVIDMDEVADATGKDGEKPAFYVSEQSQQRKFTCRACGEFNDILGRFAYCSGCGTRNDLSIFEEDTIPGIRKRLNSGDSPNDCVRDGVASFDSFMAQIGRQFAIRVPMSERRKTRLTTQAFHKLEEVRSICQEWFDIDVCAGMKEDERRFAERMFFRRHVYEHNGGEIDQRYLDNSGDTSVRLKQHISETREDAHALLGSLVKMARNVHESFHQILPPFSPPIQRFEREQKWKAKHSKGGTK